MNETVKAHLRNGTESENCSLFDHFHIIETMNSVFHRIRDQLIQTFDCLFDIFWIFKVFDILGIFTPEKKTNDVIS
jgi:hypothetical protein